MNIFEAKDCYGNKVVCSKEKWEEHIITNHPEMIGKEESVSASISDPNLVQTQSSDRKMFYSNSSSSARPPLFTAVVVQYKNENDGSVSGEVRTAFLSKKIKDIPDADLHFRKLSV